MKNTLELLPAKPQHIAVRYGATTILVVLSFLFIVLLEATSGIWGFFLMFPAIFLSAVLFDRGSGFFATILSTLLLVVAVHSKVGFAPPEQYSLPIALFAVVGFGVATMSEALRKGWEKAVEAEAAKDLLYRELAHRTKNDLAMAAAVLRLQARSQANAEVHAALMSAVGRLQVLSKAHEQFEPVAGEQGVQMRDYLQGVCNLLRGSLGTGTPIEVKLDCDPIKLPIARAIPLGLMTNELVTNAYKHAFEDGTGGTITITCRQGSPITLTVADDGKGCPDNIVEGLGSRLTQLLVKQIGGTMRREKLDRGCRISVTIPESSA
jgi:two-component system, sensor histidine kinase PdtaS